MNSINPMNSMKNIVIAVAVSTLLVSGQAGAFSFGDLAKQVIEKVAVEKAADSVSEAVNGGDDAAQKQAATPPQDLASAAPVVSAPLSVALEAKRGSFAIFAKRPKVALAGYNVGAFQTAKISASTSREQGASVSMSLTLQGVDATMLQRIADAAHADLVAQLQGAGIDVIDAPTFFQSVETAEVDRSSTPVDDEKMDGRAPKKILMAGPSNVGAVTSFGLISTGFNGNVGDQASAALDAIVVYPNVALDFAWTSGGGQSMLQRRVSVDAGARFALDSISNFQVIYSRDGRFVDDSATLGLSEDLGVDDAFAAVEKANSSNNSGSVGFANALGFGMSSRKGTEYAVTVDPQRYETLAMNAARGFNAALVQKIKVARGI